MKKVKSVEDASPEVSEKGFSINLSNGSSSPFRLVKDEGEWVLQGDSEQRFSQSELRAILSKIDSLNGRVVKKSKRK